MSLLSFAGLFWWVEIMLIPPVQCISEIKRALSQIKPPALDWPSNAPVLYTSLIIPAEGDQSSCCKKPAYLTYPTKWKPDGLVKMLSVSSDDNHHTIQIPSPQGTWDACCYTSAKQAELDVDMQGYRMGTPEHERASAILLKYSKDGTMPECSLKKPAQASAQSVKRLRSTPEMSDRSMGELSASGAYERFNQDGDDQLNLLETLLLARQLPYRDTQEQAFPFGFQHQVMKSILTVDMDKDREVNMHPNEFSAWFDSVQNGTFRFAFDF
jgi:hypothetical protein